MLLKLFLSTLFIIFGGATTSSEIQVIDFRPFIFGNEESKLLVVEQIKSALETIGFFLIENHGVPQYLIDAGFSMQKRFFYQTMDEKEMYKKKFDNSSHGVCGWYRNELLYGNIVDKKETYDIKLQSVMDDYDLNFFTAQELNDFFDLSLSMKAASQYMLNALSLGLNGSELFLSDIHNNLYESWIRFVYYNQDTNPSSSNDSCLSELLLQPHTDFLTVTMGFQDENGGLEAWDKYNKKWIHIPYKKNAMIVNIGDAMQRWSNDRYIANFHRLKNIQNNNERFSYYMFVGPARDQIIDPQSFNAKHDDLMHEPATLDEYLTERGKYQFPEQKEKMDEKNDQSTGDLDALSC